MKLLLHEKALTLRKQGLSIRSIARTLTVSASSVSSWCKDIKLTVEQKERLDTEQRETALLTLAPFIAARKNGKVRDFAKQKAQAEKDVGQTSKRDLLMLGLGLYWGEGYKRGSEEWGFTNSDPEIIRTVLTWVREHYGVGKERIIARLTLNIRYKRESKRILHAWIKQTEIPKKQFGPITFIDGFWKSKLPDKTYRGTLRIKIRKGTSLRRRVLASISEIGRQINANSRKTSS